LAVYCDPESDPVAVNCWDEFVFNPETCAWDNTGIQAVQPAIVDCWDAFEFNTETCDWDDTGTPQEAPYAGVDGVLIISAGTTPTEAELFTELGGTPETGGTPDEGGVWSNVGMVYTYTVTAIAPCTENDSATVTVTEETIPINADPGIGISMNPPSVLLGSTGILSATLGNFGNGAIVENSLRVTISVSNNAEILEIAPGGDMRWSLLSLTTGSSNTITLTNSGGAFGSFDVGDVLFIVRGNVMSDPEVISGNIVYITTQNPALCGGCASPPLNTVQGDASSSNNNATTSLAVICGQQDEIVNVESCIQLEEGTVVTTETTIEGCEYDVTTITTWIGQLDETVNIESCIELDAGTVVTTETNANGCEYDVIIITTWIGQSGPMLVGDYPIDVDYTCAEPCPIAPILEFTDPIDNDLVITYTETTVEFGCGDEVTRTWTATNFCGNSVTVVQVLTSYDNVAPVVQYATPDMTISCSDEMPEIEVVFVDNCDTELTVVVTTAIEGFECDRQVIKTCVATDDCGNSVSTTTVITIIDSTEPILFGVPSDMTLECDQDVPDAIVMATDNCDDNLVVALTAVTNPMACGYELIRTWTTVDECGNEASETQTINVVDSTIPFVVNGVPAEITLEFDEPEPTDFPTFDDNCDDDLDLSATSGINNLTDCGWDIERTWTATDNCGNSVTVSQTIHFLDSEAPVLTGVPDDSTVECDAVPLAANVTATDGGDIEFTEVITPGEPAMIGGHPCGWTIERTWRATDLCGNTTVAIQTITVVDTTAPDLIGVPADVTVDCSSVPDAPVVTAVDNCDEFPLVIVLEENILPLDCGYQLIRTWIVEDNCWNYNSQSQVITVTDTVNPELSGVPEDVTVDCSSIPDPADVTASDNCTNTFIGVNLSEETFPLDCGYALIRYWTAHDNCGNTVTESQVITVTDTIAPELIGAPADMTVDCANIPAPEMLEATDNCGDVQVIFTEEATGTCDYDLIRIWRAIDACGNSDIHTQTIHVTDTTSPDFGSFEVQVFLSCEELSSYEIEVTGGCVDPELTYEDTSFSGGCFGVIQRTWTATDACGNFSTALQFIHQFDDTNPEIFNVPEDLIVQCGEDVPEIAMSVSATDNCDDDVDISFSEEVTSEFCPYVITRTWIAEDDCGNITEGTQVITIEVDTPEQVSIFSYPNPFNDSFTVNFSVPQNAAVNAKVVDGMGRTVSIVFDGQADGARLYEYTLSGLDWAPGSYTLMMVVGGEVHHHKLMVQNN